MSTVVTNRIQSRTGSVITVPAGNRLAAPGHVLQVSAVTIGPTVQTISSATPVAVTGLSIAFTPFSASSLILVDCQISSNSPHVSSFGVYKDGAVTVSTSGQTNGNQDNMQITTYVGADTTDHLWCWPIQWSETAGSVVARTYQIFATAAWVGTPRTLTINNRPSNDMASFSFMTVTEIAQ
jgi:hypothetical protein